MGVDRTSRRAAPTSSNNNPFDDDDDDNNGRNSSLTTGNGPSSAAVSGGRAHSRQPTANAGNNKQGFITNGTPTGGTITVAPPPHDPMLDHYESKLQQTVDADFFNDPQTFTALDRVISIISAEITLSGGNITPGSTIATNFNHLPQYQAMEAQGKIVEEAIEHMAIRHCADLNSSVAAVGRMSRQFDEAKIRVRNLRRQVNDVKDSLRLGELNDSGGGGGGGIVMVCSDVFHIVWMFALYCLCPTVFPPLPPISVCRAIKYTLGWDWGRLLSFLYMSHMNLMKYI
jgi:hypothetical protein